MSHNYKRVFSADAIRTKDVFSVEAGFINISGVNVSGENGAFDHLYVGGIKHIPKINLIYAFRFGGEVTRVPYKIPKGSNTYVVSGIYTSTNKVFVDNKNIFKSGDHIIINPYGISGSTVNYQEEATVSSVNDYHPIDCCDTKSLNNSSPGDSSITFDYSRLNLEIGDKIYMSGTSQDYTVTNVVKEPAPSINGFATLNPALLNYVNINDCICLTKPFLQIDGVLGHDYPTGTIIANKFGKTTEILTGNFYENTGINCYSKCDNTDHLYLEIGTGLHYYNGQVYNEDGMNWVASGYRENFIGYSGIDVHITGLNKHGLLTLIYPKE